MAEITDGQIIEKLLGCSAWDFIKDKLPPVEPDAMEFLQTVLQSKHPVSECWEPFAVLETLEEMLTEAWAIRDEVSARFENARALRSAAPVEAMDEMVRIAQEYVSASRNLWLFSLAEQLVVRMVGSVFSAAADIVRDPEAA